MLSTNSLLGVTKDKLSCTKKNESFTNRKVMRGKEIMNQRIWVLKARIIRAVWHAVLRIYNLILGF